MNFPKRYLSILSLACLAVSAFYSAPAMACICPIRHLTDIFCEADYVAVVGIWAKYIYPKQLYSYQIKVYQSFKTTPDGNKTLESGRLISSVQDEICFVNLAFRKYYLIAGKGPELSECDFVKNVDEMTNDEKKIFKGDYSNQCNWY